MDRDSQILLQRLDCNCNDCKFMERNQDRFKQSLEKHYNWALFSFNNIRDNLYKKSENWKRRGFIEKAKIVKKQADKMKFQFNKKEVTTNYGKCHKFAKNVSFIPGILQLHTQECFHPRREEVTKIELQAALNHPIWKAHKRNKSIYFMDGKNERWDLVYYPIFQDGETYEFYEEPRALFQNLDKPGFWSKEVPLRYVTVRKSKA